ncbi:MAG TPA: deaminase [Candidatus Saccharimonadales bacterium]|nr:deaminase [Candidatus Saccharimonadales bacterium]
MTDQDYLKRAVQLAGQSPEPVGCAAIITVGGKILAEAFNSQRADNLAINHAEIKALVAANYKSGKRKLTHAVVYCSCEPCAMCLAALSYANVQRIVFNKKLSDLFPNDRQARFDSQEFVKTLNFVPILEQLLI